jgi:hypothetical protein
VNAAPSAAQFVGPVLRSFAPSLLIYRGSQHLDRGISQTGSRSFVLFTLLLPSRRVEEGFESLLGQHDVMLLLK